MDVKLPKQPLKEVGDTGLQIYSGIIQQEFLKDLRISGNAGGYKVYDEMRRNSPVIGALLNATYQAVMAADWAITSEDGEEDPRLELVNAALDNMDFTLREHIYEALTMLPFGFSLFEIVYQRVGGSLLWKKFAFRGQDTVYKWDIDSEKDKGRINGFWQQSANTYIATMIPMNKVVHYRTSSERNNPEGVSILRNSYVPYYYSKNIAAIEAIGIERDLAGIPIVTLPQTASSDPSDDDFKEAEQLVRRVRNDEQAGVVLPFGYVFELAGSSSSRQNDAGGVISRYEKRMLMSALAQFLVLGMDQVGAQALSSDQTDFFNMSANTFAELVADTFTSQAIQKLLILNGKDPNGIRLEYSPAGDINPEVITKALQQAAGLFVWTAQDEIWLRSLMGLPEKTVDEIEAAMKDEQDRSMASLANFNQPQQPKEDTEDEFAIKAVTNLETKWDRAINRFFKEQRGRIVDSVSK